MSLSTRQIALAAAFLALVFIAHASGRVLQIGGAQLAPSIAIYVIMALFLAPNLAWTPLVFIGLAVGLLTMIATSSPFPLANIPGHGLGFLFAAYLAKRFAANNREASTGQVITVLLLTTVVSWTLFALFTWLGLANTPFAARDWARFGANFGKGFLAWWLSGFIGVGVPTMIISIILGPLLYRAVRPALIRQGSLRSA